MKDKILNAIKHLEKAKTAKLVIIKPNNAKEISNLGVFAGSFNPLTFAHIELIKQSRKIFKITPILILFDLYNTDKPFHEIPLFHRIYMVYLYFKEDKNILLGITNRGLFIEKLRLLDNYFGKETKIWFIMGTDTYIRVLDKKYYCNSTDIEELFNNANFIVFERGLCNVKPNKSFPNIHFVELPANIKNISATDIREKIKNNQDIHKLTPQKIISYISRTPVFLDNIYTPVVTSLVQKGRKILVVKRSKKVGSYQGKWSGISGFIEIPESLRILPQIPEKRLKKLALQQAYKELFEETKLLKKTISYIVEGATIKVYDEKIKRLWHIFPFLIKLKQKDVKINLDWENVKYQWISPKKILEFDTVPKLKEIIASFFIKKNIYNDITKEIVNDNQSGSIELAFKLLSILKTRVDKTSLRFITYILENKKPMSALTNIIKMLEKNNKPAVIEKKIIASNRALIVEGAKIIKPYENILTYSYSSTIFNILRNAKEKGIRVYIPNEKHSQQLGEKLKNNGIDVRTISLNQLSEKNITKVIISADTLFSDYSIINAKGTIEVVKSAKIHNIPVYCFAQKLKLIKKRANISKINLSNAFEFIPAKYISKVILK